MAFKLQKGVLNERMITFQRTRILQELEREPEFASKLGKLPKDQPTTEFIELSCLQRILAIYQLLQHNRHLDSPSADQEQLLLPHLPMRLRFAVLPILAHLPCLPERNPQQSDRTGEAAAGSVAGTAGEDANE